jgi:sulfide:quinone oxidoreductase
MKKIVILGGGLGGTMMINKLSKVLSHDEWQIILIDKSVNHYYQPGFLFIPFGTYSVNDVIKPKKNFYPIGANIIISEIKKIEAEKNRVILKDNSIIKYDFLIIATGVNIKPEETDSLKGELWHKNIFDFYTVEGAKKLFDFFRYWKGGKLVLNIAEMPIKCPVAPLEFVFLADYFFTERGIRDKVDISFVTPLSGAFTKPISAKVLGDMLDKKNINLIPDFNISRVDNNERYIESYDDMKVDFDVLISIPVNMGDEFIERSGIGDDLNLIPTDKHTLQSKYFDNIFVIGDASDLPTSKAGSVAHFESDILFENILSAIDERPLLGKFDGHANCFIESGFDKGILIDFNYDTEPLPGKYPLPGIGPFSLLEETKMNHFGKIMFRWMYWNFLLKGVELPIESHMMMAGKRLA